MDANNKEEKDDGVDARAGKPDEVSAHDAGNRAAGADRGKLRPLVEQTVSQARHNAAEQIEDQVLDAAHALFEAASESPEKEHVAEYVGPSGMQEHAGEQRARLEVRGYEAIAP